MYLVRCVYSEVLSILIPESFYKYFFLDRVEVLKKICVGGASLENYLIDFTRTTPVVITYGPAGLSGSVKMVGFIPKEEYLEDLVEKAIYYAYENRPRDMREISCLLYREFYRLDYMDPMVLGGLEMAYKHSWVNINATREATLLFYTPPTTSFEVRCSVEIHDKEDDLYRVYLNSLHDLFHWSGRRSSYPAYLFKIREIYDNSVSKNGFGRRIYPL